MISKHTDNMNDPIAHKMEIILGYFYEAALSWWIENHERVCFNRLFRQDIEFLLKCDKIQVAV